MWQWMEVWKQGEVFIESKNEGRDIDKDTLEI